eukprot:363413-Chlamydomonas_euryale.AAC.3
MRGNRPCYKPDCTCPKGNGRNALPTQQCIGQAAAMHVSLLTRWTTSKLTVKAAFTSCRERTGVGCLSGRTSVERHDGVVFHQTCESKDREAVWAHRKSLTKHAHHPSDHRMYRVLDKRDLAKLCCQKCYEALVAWDPSWSYGKARGESMRLDCFQHAHVHAHFLYFLYAHVWFPGTRT